jgi:hypothetical protein
LDWCESIKNDNANYYWFLFFFSFSPTVDGFGVMMMRKCEALYESSGTLATFCVMVQYDRGGYTATIFSLSSEASYEL